MYQIQVDFWLFYPFSIHLSKEQRSKCILSKCCQIHFRAVPPAKELDWYDITCLLLVLLSFVHTWERIVCGPLITVVRWRCCIKHCVTCNDVKEIYIQWNLDRPKSKCVQMSLPKRTKNMTARCYNETSIWVIHHRSTRCSSLWNILNYPRIHSL